MSTQFTGLGTGAERAGGGWFGKAATAGAWSVLGMEAARWMEARRKPQEAPHNPSGNDEAAALLFECWDCLDEVCVWMQSGAGPVEQWDGDLATNIRVCQYVQKFFPAVFDGWRARNYGKSQDAAWRETVVDALTGMRFTKAQANEAADHVAWQAGQMDNPDLSILLREALDYLRAKSV